VSSKPGRVCLEVHSVLVAVNLRLAVCVWSRLSRGELWGEPAPVRLDNVRQVAIFHLSSLYSRAYCARAPFHKKRGQ
jgi:hypothetical protein